MTDSRSENFDLGKAAEDYHDVGYFVPFLGTGMLAADAARDAQKGDWGGAAINAGLAALNFVPFGSLVGGAVKGAKAATKILPKVTTKKPPTIKPYVSKDFGSKKPTVTKPVTPKGGVVKPVAPKGGIIKGAGKGKGGFIKGALGGYLLNEALDSAGDNGPAGVTDRQLGAAVTRSAAFQAGASN